MNNFLNELELSKNKAIKRLDVTLKDAKFETIKLLLKEKSIVIPNEIDNLNSLKKYLKSKLNDKDKACIDEVFHKADLAIENTISELKKGSQTAFTNFLKNARNILEPLTQSIIDSLALKTVITLMPTITLKLSLSTILLVINGYKLSKNIKYKNMVNKSYECNRILSQLEITKDENGNIIDTRFDQETVKTINEFLKRNKITYLNTGYLSLRECLMKLDTTKKEELINIINNLNGNKIDVNKILAKYDETLKDKIKKNILKPIVVGGAAGASFATSVNAIEPALTAGIYNGTFIGTILSKLSNSKLIGFLSGITTNVGAFFLKYIPLAGPAFENFMAYENLIVSSILGGVVSISYQTLKNILKGSLNVKEKITNNKEHLNNLELDSRLYYDENIEELRKINEYYKLNGPNNDEIAIMVIVMRYMEENNIIIENKPTCLNDLKFIISNLNKKDKRKINKLLNDLETLYKNNYSYFKKYISSLGNMLYLSISLSLAGLSIIDIVYNGEFLTNLSDALYNRDKQLTPIDITKVNFASNNNVPIQHENITPTPRPLDHPNVETTPAPPQNFNNLNKTTQSLDILNEFLNNPNSFITRINSESGINIYKYLQQLAKEEFISASIEKMDYNSLIRLYDYIKSINEVSKEDIYFKIITTSLNNQINNINNSIMRERRLTSILADATALTTLPIDYKYKQKKIK